MKRIANNAFPPVASNSFTVQNNTFSEQNNIAAPPPAFSVQPVQVQSQQQQLPSGFGNTQAPAVVPTSQARLFQDPAPAFSFSFSQNPVSNISNSPAISTNVPVSQPPMFNNLQFNQNNQTVFGGNSTSTVSLSENNLSNYSNLSELTESELNSYQAGTFKFGLVPMKPPPNELCVNVNYHM